MATDRPALQLGPGTSCEGPAEVKVGGPIAVHRIAAELRHSTSSSKSAVANVANVSGVLHWSLVACACGCSVGRSEVTCRSSCWVQALDWTMTIGHMPTTQAVARTASGPHGRAYAGRLWTGTALTRSHGVLHRLDCPTRGHRWEAGDPRHDGRPDLHDGVAGRLKGHAPTRTRMLCDLDELEQM